MNVRCACVALAVLSPMPAAPVAEAAVAPGTYRGTTTRGEGVGFNVSRSQMLTSVSFTNILLACTDGDRFRATQRLPVTARISRTGRFSVQATGAGSGGRAGGRIRSLRASGTLRIFARFDPQNQPDPNGSVLCDSGTLRWRATKRR
jgi:hypothetical protein